MIIFPKVGYYLNFILIIIIKYSSGTAYFIGNQDKTICKSSYLNQSCDHQLPMEIRNSLECNIKLIPRNECSDYYVQDVFEPKKIPFNLELLKIDDEILNTVFLNISFPYPKWKSLSFTLKNKIFPENTICGEFSLSTNHSVEILSSLFWNCYIFEVQRVEENFYDLFVEEDDLFGGIYSFKINALQNYDVEVTNVTAWHVFFFIHQHYLENSGKLVITLQPAPFSNISYAISLVRCLVNKTLKCEERIEIYLITLSQERFSREESVPISVDLKTVSMPGFYAVSIQILSPLCLDGRCQHSFSPIFEWPRSYTTEIIIGFSVFGLLLALSTFFIIRRIHRNVCKYIKMKTKNMDSVLFVYLAESEESLLLFEFLSRVFSEKFCVRPLVVEEDVGAEDPNDWTRHHLYHASKVLFFVPKDATLQSCTPIQYQWHCAINYFSGSFLKEKPNILSRCATVILPKSYPLLEREAIYSLKRFYLDKDLTSIANWLHRDRFLDRILYWQPIVKRISHCLSAFIGFAVDPINNARPKNSLIRLERKEPPASENSTGSCSFSSSEEVEENEEEQRATKIARDFDPLIPPVGHLSSDESSEYDDDDDEGSEGASSQNDVMNFAT